MRGTKAKRIRREVYGDYSIKEERKYVVDNHGAVRNTGRRAIYLKRKKSC